MKKITFTILSLLSFTSVVNSQIVGDPAEYSVDFNNNSLLYQGTSQGYPKVIINSSIKSVIWPTNFQPVVLKHTNLNSSYTGTTINDVLTDMGNQNSTSVDVQHAVCYDTISNKFLSVYRHNYYQGVNKDYSLKAVLYDENSIPATSFYIEGPFQYTSDAPSMPSIAVNSNSVFCVAYHSSLTSGSTSIVKVKFVDANTSTVTPAPTAGTQNGIELTFQGAQHPSVAWNETAGVFGIVYTTGSGNNQKIKFVSCDASGTIVTAQKDVVADNQIQVQYPKIYADGNDFVIVWRDYREVTIDPVNNAPINGIPAIRIAQIDAVGNIKTLSGDAELFDVNDNSLLLSNPYFSEAYYEFDLKVITPNQKYAVVWGTANVVPSIEYATVNVTGGTIKSTIPKTISNNGSNSFGPSIDYDFSNQNYVVTYYEHNGTNYENRVCSGVQSTVNQVGLEKNELNFKIYPNPVENNLMISGDVLNSQVKIYNLNGEVLYTGTINKNNSIINISNFKSGVYFIEIKNKTSIQQEKIIKL